ncbi:hypothetical protein BJF93_06935 [Xaviernesmea oryzae]|uniref:Ribbon-helix-helix protein CopG domain-containing protein n=1 Tax=Xaviernesmea oryzae TaxID=464029 RepID=A0A1Q9ASB3_9HYPH|nr:ribbon-helix-helix protein, CopG family [Xaviernesmea oryzae]OLP58332.1 hypothetical protein BJF93_06935 [Xaviernesmea oryzae]SEL41630.1 Predicted transcriptional regulator [Xaviernesmea oryzae]
MSDLTISLPDETVAKLAERLDRSRSTMLTEAIEDFVAREDFHFLDIKARLAEADRGSFASGKELAAVIGKYTKATRPS